MDQNKIYEIESSHVYEQLKKGKVLEWSVILEQKERQQE